MADQLTKLAALAALSRIETLPLWEGVLHLTLVFNTGIAFGLFRGQEGWLFGLITASLLILIVWSLGLRKAPRLARTGLVLILGGAIGNWIDRLRFQAVVDFIDLRVWPVFNLADTSITIGVLIYLFLLLKGDRKRSAAYSAQSPKR